jgi:hypothetical protein
MSAANRVKFKSSLIGQRLVEAGHLTKSQLSQALTHQSETGLLFGEVCLLKGWVSYQQLKDCLPTLRSRLGERLISSGYISIEQLWLALLEQRHTGDKLGDILINRGWIDNSILTQVMARPASK